MNATYSYLLCAVIVLQLADIVTTYVGLKSRKAIESNGFLARLMARVGVLPALMIIKGVFIGWLLYFSPLLPVWALGVICAGYCVVIFNNVLVLQKGAAHG